jgi:hypothetical protein
MYIFSSIVDGAPLRLLGTENLVKSKNAHKPDGDNTARKDTSFKTVIIVSAASLFCVGVVWRIDYLFIEKSHPRVTPHTDEMY